MGRYLFRIAYIGTNFSGIQLQSPKGKLFMCDKSVSAELLKCLGKNKYPFKEDAYKVHCVSRTDSGVHALNNILNIDIEPRIPGKMMSLGLLKDKMNYRLTKHKHDLRVLDIQRVADDLKLREYTKYRRYIYRLAVARSPDIQLLPVYELNRCRLIFQPFDFDKFLQTATALSGTHIFTGFTPPKFFKRPENADKSPVRTVEIGVKRGCTMFENLSQMPDEYEMFDIHIKSRGFLYRQVRRMVSAMIQAARGKLNVDEIEKILDDPSYEYHPETITAISSDGLYLSEVKCDPEALVYREESNDENVDGLNLDKTVHKSIDLEDETYPSENTCKDPHKDHNSVDSVNTSVVSDLERNVGSGSLEMKKKDSENVFSYNSGNMEDSWNTPLVDDSVKEDCDKKAINCNVNGLHVQMDNANLHGEVDDDNRSNVDTCTSRTCNDVQEESTQYSHEQQKQTE